MTSVYHPLYSGDWRVIVQSPGVEQRVGVDMCHDVDLPCPGLADCGKKSRCVQRYSFQVIINPLCQCRNESWNIH